MKFWRLMASKQMDGTTEIRTGRKLRDAMHSIPRQGILTKLHIWLINRIK